MNEIEKFIGNEGKFVETEELRKYLVSHTEKAFEIARRITGRRGPIYLFGGTIRNLLLNTETSAPDYDFIGDFDFDQIQRDFPDQFVGRWDSVSTMRLKLGNDIYDFTSAKDIEKQLAQNDITTSNLCMSEDGTIIDFFGAIESMQKREIKMINPEEKIKSDPVRILRAFRFATELDFTIEEATLSAAINNASLLANATNLDDDLCQILSLRDETRENILKSLKQYGIDRYLDLNLFEAIDVYTLEKELAKIPHMDEIARLFKEQTYLVGGAVRDHIWGKKINDLDIKINLPITEVINILEKEGYQKSSDYHTNEHQYYVSSFAGVAGAMMDGFDVHFSTMDTPEISTMVDSGDVNFSCCIYNPHTKRIETPEAISDIKNKRLYFCNIENAQNDPLIIVSALKQISRLPDIVVPDETNKIIENCIPKVVEYFDSHPEHRYKIESLCGNLNSESVYALFKGENQKIFEGCNKKIPKLKVTSPKYTSQTFDELSVEDRNGIVQLASTAYGEKFDINKLFSDKINSVVFEKKDGQIISLVTVDSERVYTSAAKSGRDYTGIFADLVKNNYNIWCSVYVNSTKIQALISLGGLKLETNPEVMMKILVNKCHKLPENIDIHEEKGMLVFQDKNKSSYPQIILRS